MCRIDNRALAENIFSVSSIAGNDGSVYAVQSVRCAYKESTKEVLAYMETERVSEETIEEYLLSAGAGSVRIDSFSAADWKQASARALGSVLEFSRSDGYILLQYGAQPKAAAVSNGEPGNDATSGTKRGQDGASSSSHCGGSSSKMPRMAAAGQGASSSDGRASPTFFRSAEHDLDVILARSMIESSAKLVAASDEKGKVVMQNAALQVQVASMEHERALGVERQKVRRLTKKVGILEGEAAHERARVGELKRALSASEENVAALEAKLLCARDEETEPRRADERFERLAFLLDMTVSQIEQSGQRFEDAIAELIRSKLRLEREAADAKASAAAPQLCALVEERNAAEGECKADHLALLLDATVSSIEHDSRRFVAELGRSKLRCETLEREARRHEARSAEAEARLGACEIEKSGLKARLEDEHGARLLARSSVARLAAEVFDLHRLAASVDWKTLSATVERQTARSNRPTKLNCNESHFAQLCSVYWSNDQPEVNMFIRLPDDEGGDDAPQQEAPSHLRVRLARGIDPLYSSSARLCIMAFFYQGSRVRKQTLVRSSVVKEAYGVEVDGIQYLCLVLFHKNRCEMRAMPDLVYGNGLLPRGVVPLFVPGSLQCHHISVFKKEVETDDPVLAMLKRPNPTKWKWFSNDKK